MKCVWTLAAGLCVAAACATFRPTPDSMLDGVTVTFARYAEATDPLEVRLNEPNGGVETLREGGDPCFAISNKSKFVITLPTYSMYLRPFAEWDACSNGRKQSSLKDRTVIVARLDVLDRHGVPVPGGIDRGATSRLSPGTSAVFCLPRALFRSGYTAVLFYGAEDPETCTEVVHNRAYHVAIRLPGNGNGGAHWTP